MHTLAQVNILDKFRVSGDSFLTQTKDVGKLATIFVSNALIIAGLILLVFMIGAGISMIGSAGSDNSENLEKGKKAVTSALIGFIIVFIAYWIVQLLMKLTGIPGFFTFGIPDNAI